MLAEEWGKAGGHQHERSTEDGSHPFLPLPLIGQEGCLLSLHQSTARGRAVQKADLLANQLWGAGPLGPLGQSAAGSREAGLSVERLQNGTGYCEWSAIFIFPWHTLSRSLSISFPFKVCYLKVLYKIWGRQFSGLKIILKIALTYGHKLKGGIQSFIKSVIFISELIKVFTSNWHISSDNPSIVLRYHI